MRVRALLAILVVVSATALLARVPILGVPSYEPGLVVGALSVLACAWLSSRRARIRPANATLRWGLLDASPGEAVLAETRANARVAAALVGLPLILLVTEALRSECRLDAGPWIFVFIAAPAAFAGMSLGTLAGSLTRRPRRIFALVGLAVLLCAAAAAAEALIGPRTVVHDFLLGPLSASGYMGYDTGTAFPASAYLHRAWSVVVSCALLVAAALARTWTDAPPMPEGMSRDAVDAAADGFEASRASPQARTLFLLRHHRRAVLRTLALVVLVASPFAAMHDRAGITSGNARLGRALPATAETAHFRIHYAPGTAAEAHLPRLAVDLEWSREQICGWLGIDPEWKIDAWIHPDSDSLFELTGARGFLFAKPWQHAFHGVLERGRIRAVRHELVHVLAADFGPPPLRCSIRMGLTEGLASALDEGFARSDHAHREVAAAAVVGHLPAARDLFSLTRFGGTNMDLGYRSAGSFVGWLLMTHGPEPLRRVYGWGDFSDAYGEDLDRLEKGWRRFLAERVAATASDVAEARRRFDPAIRPAFYRIRCARLGEIASFGPTERADLLSWQGLPDQAADVYCSLPEASSDPRILESAARERVRAGRFEAALDLADAALRAQPPDGTRLGPIEVLVLRLNGRLGRVQDARNAASVLSSLGAATWREQTSWDLEALERADLRERYFSAALASRPDDALLLAGILAADPSFAPAMNLLLERDPTRRPVSAARRELVYRLAAVAPGGLAAHRLVELSRALEDEQDWAGSGEACARALAIHGKHRVTSSPWDVLEAEDCAGRAAWAPRVQLRPLPAQLAVPAGRR